MVQLTLKDISPLLTEDVVDKAFKLKTTSQEKIQSLELSRAAPAGSGLMGAVLRITVTSEKHRASFIAKGLVKDPLLRKSLQSEVYFQREILFFSKVLPALIDVQKSSGAKEKIQNIVPICYAYYCDGENDYLLLEDLSERLYSSVPNNATTQERDAILKCLAHLHAASMCLRIKRAEEFEKLKNSLHDVYYTENRRDYYAKYLNNAVEIVLKALAEYEDPVTSVYYKKFVEIVSNDPFTQMMNMLTLGDHATFNHGDAWTPNFLCSTEGAVAVDFQLYRCASPVTDLSFFLALSANTCRTKADFLKSVVFYYNHLIYYLKDMGIDSNAFSWRDLHNELQTYGKFGLLCAITSIPLLDSKKCDVLEKFEEKYAGRDKIPLEELWQLTPLTTNESKINLVNLIRTMVDLGYI